MQLLYRLIDKPADENKSFIVIGYGNTSKAAMGVAVVDLKAGVELLTKLENSSQQSGQLFDEFWILELPENHKKVEEEGKMRAQRQYSNSYAHGLRSYGLEILTKNANQYNKYTINKFSDSQYELSKIDTPVTEQKHTCNP